MSSSEERRLGKRDGIRWTITWLHRRADSMRDQHAKNILNSAAFDLGNEIREGRMPLMESAIARSLLLSDVKVGDRFFD